MRTDITKADILNGDQTLADLYDVEPKIFGAGTIDVLSLPCRAYKRISGLGVVTIAGLLVLPVYRLMCIGGFGYKCFLDLGEALQNYLESGEKGGQKSNEDRLDPTQVFIKVESLDLSQRSVNCLKRAGIHTLGDLLKYSRQDLLKIGGLGNISADEIMGAVENTPRILEEYRSVSGTESSELFIMEIKAVSKEMDAYFGQGTLHWQYLFEVENVMAKRHSIGELVEAVYMKPDVQAMLISFVRARLSSNRGFMMLSHLFSELPSHLFGSPVMDVIFDRMTKERLVRVYDDFIIGIYPRALDCVEYMPDLRAQDVFRRRLLGGTYSAIGKVWDGLTRERVRQIILKALKYLPRVHEDIYRGIFVKYRFTAEDLAAAFDEPPCTFNYLMVVDDTKQSNKQPLLRALDDPAIPQLVKDRLRTAIYRDFILIDDEYVGKTRALLIDGYIRHYCKQQIRIEDFIERYHDFLKEKGLDLKKYGISSAPTVENDLQNSGNVLWDIGHRFRAYDIDGGDFDKLWNAFDIERYRGLEISTLLLYRQFPALMKEYDIRNEYELHNFMRKTAGKRVMGLSFSRMPCMSVGEASREEQVREVFNNNIPASLSALCRLYEEKFGLRNSLTIPLFINMFGEYYHDGWFDTMEPTMPQEMIERLREVFVDDIYDLNDVYGIFAKEFPDNDTGFIDETNMRCVGFRLYPEFILSNKHNNATDYFKGILTKEPIVDLSGDIDRLKRISSFNHARQVLISEMVIAEILPGKFINIRESNSYGITADMVEAFCRNVHEFVPANTMFTVTSLRKSGFQDPLFDKCMDEYVYNSILNGCSAFSCRRVGTTRLFRNGQNGVVYAEFIEKIMGRRKEIGFKELTERLMEDYGILLRKGKISMILASSALVYDEVAKSVRRM